MCLDGWTEGMRDRVTCKQGAGMTRRGRSEGEDQCVEAWGKCGSHSKHLHCCKGPRRQLAVLYLS